MKEDQHVQANDIVEEEEEDGNEQPDFDLNLPFNEFGEVDMDFIQNMNGNCVNSCPWLHLLHFDLSLPLNDWPLNKASLERLDILPISIPCPPELLEEAEATTAAM